MTVSVTRIAIRPRPGFPDGLGRKASELLGLPSGAVQGERVYYLATSEALDDREAKEVALNFLADPLADDIQVGETQGDWSIEVALRPGVTDNEGKVASEILSRGLGRPVRVHYARRFVLAAGAVGERDGEGFASRCCAQLGNPVVERFRIVAGGRRDPAFSLDGPVPGDSPDALAVELPEDDAALARLSTERMLALSVDELRAIRAYFADLDVQRERDSLGMPAGAPTDVELEAIAQTWSEHCKHKVFNDRVVVGSDLVIEDGLFKTFIRSATTQLASERDFLVSVFTDNAGVIRFDPEHHLVFKVETHNSPSALEPYGGALTGIVGVNRDPAGTGLGCRLLFNTDVFCLAPLDGSQPLPKGVLPPRAIWSGIRKGVEDGGNQSGIPTVDGAVYFDERFVARPLVFCGTGGLMPRAIGGRPAHLKEILPGDLVVMVGGRVGRDGIHGATFSSEGVADETPSSVVQIGDPITQKLALDALAEARQLGLYRAITDNGAGGLSSSVGELALLSGGCEIALDAVPLKAAGLLPWEILVSESQERMTLAVPPELWADLSALCERRGVEATVVGRFTETGRFVATFEGRTVAHLDLRWLHYTGLPRRTLEAEWPSTPVASPSVPALGDERDWTPTLLSLLSAPNICSREGLVRQYDHEVQGGSVIKPLVGVRQDGPSDAAVVRPRLDSTRAVAISNGLGCRFADLDPYWMAVDAVDEAVRNAVCVGGDPDHLAILDNFCWPDPVFDPERNLDGKSKMGALVRACQGLHDAALAYGTPIISGKDSVKNDFYGPGGKLSAPPTLLVSAIAVVPDAARAVTMDFKAAGDRIYVLGLTRPELGATEFDRLHPGPGAVPTVDPALARRCYQAVHRAMQADLVASCHDASEGGLAVALAESALAGELGATCDLSLAPGASGLAAHAVLFAESAGRLLLSIAPEDRDRFEAIFEGLPMAFVGHVTGPGPGSTEQSATLQVAAGGRVVVRAAVGHLKKAWQETPQW